MLYKCAVSSIFVCLFASEIDSNYCSVEIPYFCQLNSVGHGVYYISSALAFQETISLDELCINVLSIQGQKDRSGSGVCGEFWLVGGGICVDFCEFLGVTACVDDDDDGRRWPMTPGLMAVISPPKASNSCDDCSN